MRASTAAFSVLSLLSGFVSLGCEEKAKVPAATVNAASPAGSAAAAKPLEPCGLLTEAEASEALAGTATATPSDKVPFASSCIWEAHDPRRGLIVTSSTPAQMGADPTLREVDGDTIEKRFAQVVQTQMGQEGGATPVPGLGDAAVWAAKAGQLWIMKKNRALISVSFHGGAPAAAPGAATFEKCRAVGQKLATRL